jgi:uncharacterized beta-barrel protein YwiB (DUF1934 family)
MYDIAADSYKDMPLSITTHSLVNNSEDISFSVTLYSKSGIEAKKEEINLTVEKDNAQNKPTYNTCTADIIKISQWKIDPTTNECVLKFYQGPSSCTNGTYYDDWKDWDNCEQNTINPPTISNFTGSVDENQPIGTSVGTVNITYSDSYTLSLSGSDSEYFSINSSGQISTNQEFDYETKSLYTFDVVVTTANQEETTKSVTVNINDIDESTSTTTTTLMWETQDNSFEGTHSQAVEYCSSLYFNNYSDWRMPIGNELLSLMDYDYDELATFFSLFGDYTDIDFIDKVIHYGSISEENTDGYSGYVRCVRDDMVQKINPPTISNFTGSVDENQPIGTSVGTVSITYSNSYTLSLSGSDSEYFSINSSGQISTNQEFDYETKSSYTFDVVVTTASQEETTKTITVNINDVDESTSVTTPPSIGVLKTGQTTSYSDYDDGYYQKGLSRSYSRDDSTNIVTDHTTGLMWEDQEDIAKKNWEEAKDYCSNLSLGGYTNWRLPNLDELQSIVDREKYYPSIDDTFQNVKTSVYWNSSTYAEHSSSRAWVVNFWHGYGIGSNKDYSNYVRCVAGGQ